MVKHLFLDDRIVELSTGLKRCFHQPRKHGAAVLEPDRPEEQGRIYLWSTPAFDPLRKRWLMWYCDHDKHPLLAESDDGIHWQKPALPHNTGRRDRLPDALDLGFEVQEVHRKERRLTVVRPPRSSRYHALTLCCHGPRRGVLRPLLSENGFCWTVAPGTGPCSGDEYRLAYDPARQQFLATVKQDKHRVRGRYGVPEFGRAVALSLSPDFEQWSEPEMVLHADDSDQENGAARIEEAFTDPCRRAPAVRTPEEYRTDVYAMPVLADSACTLGWPTLFHQSGGNEHLQAGLGNQEGLLVPELAWSDDLYRWQRPIIRQPFIPLSTVEDRRCYDQGMIMLTAPVRRDGEFWFYYSGQRHGHASTLGEIHRSAVQERYPQETGPLGGIFLARMREDGLAALHAGADGGTVMTRVLRVDGTRLWINGAAAEGEIRAQVRDALTGLPLPGYTFGPYACSGHAKRCENKDAAADRSVPFSGDSHHARLSWREHPDLSVLQGREVRLEFFLRNADLFAFGFD